MAKIGVFISYNHKDKIIADAVVKSLTSISPDLDVFIDHSGLEGGDEYEAKLTASIQKAHWFIIICSGTARASKDMNWCFYEAGQFRAKLEAESEVSSLRSRMCYLYDGERPSQLARYQGTHVTQADRADRKLNVESENDDTLDYENTELFDLLGLIVETSAHQPLRDLTDPNVRQLVRGGVRKITAAFLRNQLEEVVGEIVFQPRISFMLPPPARDSEPRGLSSETVVVGYDATLATIFGIAGNTAKWGEIKQIVVSGSSIEPLWFADIEAATNEVAKGRVAAQTEALCFSHEGCFYRPIIARYEKYRSGAKNCYIAFIPTRNRQFNLSHRTSALLSGLILSVRFRQRVLPIVSDLKALEPAASSKKLDFLTRFQKEVISIETEAVEFGLPVPNDEHDEPPLLNAFRDGRMKDQLRAAIADWTRVKQVIFEKISAARSPNKDVSASEVSSFVIDALSEMRAINGTFVNALSEELLYAEKIEPPPG
jgi:TIR domain